ncbi:putative Armadillo repeat-containing protein [Hibiscus syriacus]|uniref:Armadillo repeat-containing protein n=1 Tax=Hibiscus syriacus TaxID=106335 RepID=A0A6A2XUR3_HIBSY|nr:putative Armadillo repeat-containing protein [Hibiscus syriacus]
MSPASKSKSKDKKSSKESQKTSSKPSGPANAVSGVPSSAYNPLLGTFHTIETVPSSSASPLQSNGESEEHKEKTSNLPVRQEIVPGADDDKREKIRQKNERKHQRQKERRAQELHERCSGYLMSRKLEALAQQLVAMGFSHDRATMALIFNEGKVEESVAWLLEGSEEAVKHKESAIGGGNLKIDISEELARIADMEIRYTCTKQEVERAVVAAEGDLEKAAEYLRSLRQDPPAPLKPEETCDPPTASANKVSVAGSQNISVRPQPKPNLSNATQQRRDEKDLNYAKAPIIVGSSSDLVSESLQPLKRIQPKLEWAKPQQSAVPAEKSWPGSGSNPSISYSLASPLQASPPSKTESHNVAVGSDFKKFQPSIREPVIMMQRPQSVNTKQVPATSISSSPPGSTPFLYQSSSVEISKSNGFMPSVATARSLSSNNLSSNQMQHQLYYPQQQHFTGSSSPGDSPGTSRGNGLWSRTGASPTLAAASSLGLFAGSGYTTSSGASSPVDWNSGSSMAQFDYTNIDWSLDRGSSFPRPGGIWLGPTSLLKGTHIYYPNTNGLNAKPAKRLTSSGSGLPIACLQDVVAPTEASPTAGSLEWTSPFEGKDLFSIPRQYVSSPTL